MVSEFKQPANCMDPPNEDWKETCLKIGPVQNLQKKQMNMINSPASPKNALPPARPENGLDITAWTATS